jgi:DNA ligase-1
VTHTLPTLYKKTSTGAIQWWTISVEPGVDFGIIITQYGQVGTENPQETRDVITKGKNVGKKNETTPYQQAVAEADAKHEKQRKKGYVTTPEAAAAGEVDDAVQGGILPMLAHKFTEQGHKIVFPAYAQPKLDGMRCIAIVDEGKATLWSRERRPIISAPHLIEELEHCFPTGRVVLDGELYNHDMKHDFERFMSIVRQKDKVHPDHKMIQYWVYDAPDMTEASWATRLAWLDATLIDNTGLDYTRAVETRFIDEPAVPDLLAEYRGLGYEGVMLRNAAGRYLNKRSYDLQKVKEFDDAEFGIVGIAEGRGRLQGHVGAFVCTMPNSDQTFEAKMSGDTGKLKEYWDDHALWTGKMLTVRYQGLTGKNGVPRFPVGVTFRDYE